MCQYAESGDPVHMHGLCPWSFGGVVLAMSSTWLDPLTDPDLATNGGDFLHRAFLEQQKRGNSPDGPFELNAGASPITIAMLNIEMGHDFIPTTKLLEAGRFAHMTLALINLHLNPSSAWIGRACATGWVYDQQGNFHRVGAAA